MSDLSLPSDYIPNVVPANIDEALLLKLAREIAIDLTPLDDILSNHNIEPIQFEAHIKNNKRFNMLLKSELEAWGSATNTPERVRLKAAAMVEEYLPELYARLNDNREKLADKVKGLEVVAKLGDLGSVNKGASGDLADKVTITINLGNSEKLEYNKSLPPKVIEHDAPEEPLKETVDVD